MVVRLDERAAVRGNPLVIVLVAGLDDLAGIGIPELLLVERVERRGMSRSIDGSLLLLVGCHCPVEALRLSILEGLPRRQSLLTLLLEVLQIGGGLAVVCIQIGRAHV